MRRRYYDHMKSIRPSEAFISRLEQETLRELRRSRKSPLPKALTAACAAALIIALICILAAKPAPDVISKPDPVLTSETTAAAAPTAPPTPEPTGTLAPAIMPSFVYPPDDVRLELEMSEEGAFPSARIGDIRQPLFQDHLAGSSTHGSHIVEICQSAELNAVVVAPLAPGTAYWPMSGDGNSVMLTDAKGTEVGYAERVQYLDENTNTLKEGWKHTVHGDEPLPEVPYNPVESVQLPGRVKAEQARLLYGKSANAPEAAILERDQLIAIGCRAGNWLYVSTEPFCLGSEAPAVGWLHITEAVGLQWRTNFAQVDLLADKVNLRESPDGKVIRSLDEDSQIYYAGATVPGKNGDWHFVSVDWLKDGTRDGYVSSEYTKLNTFRLGDELDLNGVRSAALRYSDHALYGTVCRTVGGEKLDLLLERLKNALSEHVYSAVCGECSAFITLTYSDGYTIDLPLSGDSCTQVRYGPVTYDLKTDEERTERFLNDGGAGLEDILVPIFGAIPLP